MSPSPPSRGVLLQLNRSCRSLYKSLVQVSSMVRARLRQPHQSAPKCDPHSRAAARGCGELLLIEASRAAPRGCGDLLLIEARCLAVPCSCSPRVAKRCLQRRRSTWLSALLGVLLPPKPRRLFVVTGDRVCDLGHCVPDGAEGLPLPCRGRCRRQRGRGATWATPWHAARREAEEHANLAPNAGAAARPSQRERVARARLAGGPSCGAS